MRLLKLGLLGLTALGCSGRYEVGTMDPNQATSGSAATPDGSKPGAGGSKSGAGGSAVGSGGSSTGNSSRDDFWAHCLPGTAVDLQGPFVDPSVAWARLSPFIWGQYADPPSPLPAAASTAWARQVVADAFQQAEAQTGGLPGGPWLIRKLLALDPSAPLLGNYEGALAGTSAAVPELIATPLHGTAVSDGRHVGIFSEPSWLAHASNIAARGAGMSGVLFNPVPAPPANVNMTLEPQLPERAALEASTTSAVCASCHNLFAPLGYSLLHFDAMGNYREQEAGVEIDSSGSFTLPRTGTVLEFEDIWALIPPLSGSCDASLGLADNTLRIATQELAGVDANNQGYEMQQANQERMEQLFMQGDASYLALIQAYAQTTLVLGGTIPQTFE